MSLIVCGCSSPTVQSEVYKCDVGTLPIEPTYGIANWEGCDTNKCWMLETKARIMLRNMYDMRAYKDELRKILDDLKSK